MPRMTRFSLRIIGTVVASAFVWSVVGVSCGAHAASAYPTRRSNPCAFKALTMKTVAEARDIGVPQSAVMETIVRDPEYVLPVRIKYLQYVTMIYKTPTTTPKDVYRTVLEGCTTK